MAATKSKYARQARWRARNPWARAVEWARRRCRDVAHKDFPFYGGKGITVKLTAKQAAKIWARDNAQAMKCPSLDRVDSSKNYTIKNCRFMEKSLNERLPHDAELRAAFEAETNGQEENEALPDWVTERPELEAAYAY